MQTSCTIGSFVSGDLKEKIIKADVIDGLRQLPDESVHCVVTSPPYFSLRRYGWEGEWGGEPTLQEYIDKLVGAFREIRRVLRSDGVVWLNIGDTYASSPPGNVRGVSDRSTLHGVEGESYRSKLTIGHGSKTQGIVEGFKEKDLMMIPARIIIALHDDGWWIRSDVIWSKTTGLPESVRDRPTKNHEYVFMLTKSSRYFYDNMAVRTPTKDWGSRKREVGAHFTSGVMPEGQPHNGLKKGDYSEEGARIRSVWNITPKSYPGAHTATFPPELPERCILLSTSAKGACSQCNTQWIRDEENKDEWKQACSCEDSRLVPPVVLDPFAGTGTTLVAAYMHGREAVGIDLAGGDVDLGGHTAHERIQAAKESHTARDLSPHGDSKLMYQPLQKRRKGLIFDDDE